MTGESKQRRRDKRYRTQLPVRTRLGGKVQEATAEDVSFRGLYLATDNPPPERQLIRIEASLPPNDTAFATHAMVVYCVTTAEPGGRRPGCGVQFYGMGNERRAWEAYVQHVQRSSEALPDRREVARVQPPAAAPVAAAVAAKLPPPPPPRVAVGSGLQDNRQFPRIPVVLEVRPPDVESLLLLYSRDVSGGGMFLTTPRDIAVGDPLRVDVRHPHSKEVFPLDGVVRRKTTQPLGIGVEFTDLDDTRRRAFYEFIHGPIPADDDDDLELLEIEN